MADRLTQLQDCLDDLLTQMYASLNYIQTRHPYADIEGQPSQAPTREASAATLTNGTSTTPVTEQAQPPTQRVTQEAGTPLPEQQSVFDTALRELAQDLILKEQQIEHLITSLPGLGNSEKDQEGRMRQLEEELRAVEAERMRKESEREELVNMLGEVIGKVKRVP